MIYLFPLLLLVAILPCPTTAYLKYNEIQQKNSHNSYERLEGLLDQMIYHHLRTVEIDAHIGATPGLFAVYHDAGYFQSYSSFHRLVDGVTLLQEFHDMFPNHQIVTIFMDLKGGLSGSDHTVDDYDNVISQLPLYTPADAQGNATSIQGGIDQFGWPEISDMRGKFMWILTGGQDDYCSNDQDCGQQQAFVAQSVKDATEIGRKSYSVFYNQNIAKDPDVPIGPAVYKAGYIGRAWHSDDNNTPKKWALAESHQYQHIATDRINYHRDSFSRTHNQYGYPFQTLNGVDVSKWKGDDEGGTVMHMYADGIGDAWGRQDDVHIAYLPRVEALADVDGTEFEWTEYTTSISLVNSHCEKYAKAGIMLRKENDDFPSGAGVYFSIMRTCDSLMRVQYRKRAYMLTVAELIRPDLGNNIEVAKRVGMKLRYRFDGKDSHVEGYSKLEGSSSYALIARQTFTGVDLTEHGIFTSSHYWDGNEDGTNFQALFINTKRNNETLTVSNFTSARANEAGNVFGDGYNPDMLYISTLLPGTSSSGRRNRQLRGD
jgi:hypothetical protein